MKKDYFIEDLNNLLNNGEVPNLMNHEDIGEILEIIKIKEGEDPIEMFKTYVKRHLHIIIDFSYISNNFKEKVKIYPSIVNCCTVDWFFPWPEDALTSIATYYLSNINIDKKTKNSSIEILKNMHFSTIE